MGADKSPPGQNPPDGYKDKIPPSFAWVKFQAPDISYTIVGFRFSLDVITYPFLSFVVSLSILALAWFWNELKDNLCS